MDRLKVAQVEYVMHSQTSLRYVDARQSLLPRSFLVFFFVIAFCDWTLDYMYVWIERCQFYHIRFLLVSSVSYLTVIYRLINDWTDIIRKSWTHLKFLL